ncbi:hypothetical protein C1H46_022363 [Malus baccata]|uniref:Uncharacterized protein n=1 Tax=Malus baccata TaxID=106549 RepID=A0A540M013_MALBA|nr:hypothetical protein C1H46_022363 [Malus baccata]
MATKSSEGEEDAKLTRGNQLLIVDDDLREMGKKVKRRNKETGNHFQFFNSC